MKSLIFFCALILSPLFAFSKQGQFKPLSKVQWLAEKPASQKKDIVIHYFWATWCAPCFHSTELFTKLAESNLKKIDIFAYSDEDQKTISKHLSTNPGGSSANFYYGVYDREKEQIELPFIPYAYIYYKGQEVWAGNPSYLVGQLETLITKILKDQLDVKSYMQKKNLEWASLKEVRHHRRRIGKNTQERIQLFENLYKLTKANYMRDPSSYNEFSDYTESTFELLETLRNSSKDSTKERILDLQAEIQNLAKQIAISFNGKKDELNYAVRDLIPFTKIMPLDRAQLLKLSEQSLRTKGDSQYPDYIHYIYSELLFLNGRLKESRRELNTALRIVENKNYKNAFLSIYLDHDNQLKRFERNTCNGVLKCIQKELGLD